LYSFNLAVLISGSGSNLQAIIDAVENGIIKTAKVALVVSSREGVFGLERAKKHSIPATVINNKSTAKLLGELKKHKIDGIVLAGYLSILPPNVVKAFENKIINVHPALLPMFGGKGFYGLKVHEAVLASGVKYSGATVHMVDCGVDTGAVLIRGVVCVLDDDTAESLQKRVLEVEHKIIVHAVRALSGGYIADYINKPPVLRSTSDKEGIHNYADGLKKLSEALVSADSEGI